MDRGSFWKFVSDYGDLATLAGFLLSVLGFALTIASARAARQAAEKARRAVNQMRAQLTANELAELIQTTRALVMRLSKGHHPRAIQLCTKAELGLSRIAKDPELNSEENSRMFRAVDDLRLIHAEIESRRREKRYGRISERAHSRLHDIIVILGGIQSRILSEIRRFEP